ncbi:putative F-box protein At3g16210 [Bidens hawaiensis]|uniref:putative F-box protein At3g16210 n=1 Tax=Bidens hawaiensis TaxID=980011 RepID=UPI00404A7FCD
MSVCKQWKSFLATPTFARMHLRHLTINDYKLLQLEHCGSNPNFDPTVVSIVGSLVGLVCLATTNAPAKLAFWNPFTGAYKKLSANPDITLSFNKCYVLIGFYIDSSNDYKLLYLVDGGDLAYIYSHGLDSWRKIYLPVCFISVCLQSDATFCGECLYFMAVKNESNCWIICFDTNKEKFMKIQYPPVPSGAKYYRNKLVVLNGCIHLCVSYIKDNSMKQGDLWRLLESDHDGWVKVAAFPGGKDNKLTTQSQWTCTASIGNWLAVLEENRSLKKMSTEDFITRFWDFCSVSCYYTRNRRIYVETLVSPNP